MKKAIVHSDSLIKVIKAEVKKHGSQAKAAAAAGISVQHVNAVLAGRRNPSTRIASAFGFQKVTRFERA